MSHLAAGQLVDRIRVKFGDPLKGWALLEQVASSSGWNNGYSDAIAVQLWPSRGIEIVGFEVKTSRGDWLRELRKREKVEHSAFVFCRRWYVVANKGCVECEELPAAWGLMEPHGRGLSVVVEAPELEPQEVDASFLAAVLRRAAKATGFDRKATRQDGYKDGFAEGKERGTQDVNWAQEDAGRLKARIVEFEKASGVQLDDYHGAGNIGAAVKAVLDGTGVRQLQRMRGLLQSQIDQLDEALDAVAASPPGK